MMNYDDRFQVLPPELKLDGRYRAFAQLKRIAGKFPSALRHRLEGSKQRVMVRRSNDCLGMGEHSAMLDVMHRAIDLPGAGMGQHAQYLRHNDVDHFEELMDGADPALPMIAAFESVYSMDGDIATIAEIYDVADREGPARRL